MRLVACISSGPSDGIVRALPLLVGRLASRTSIRNEFYRYRQISPFKPSDPEFSRNIYPRFISTKNIYIYIYSLFSTKRPTFFRNQSRSRLNYRWPLRISLLLPSLLSEIWKIVRSKERRKEGRKKEKRGEKESCFPEKWKSPVQQTRSLVRDIFTPRRAISGQRHRQRRFLMNRNRVSLYLWWKTSEIISVQTSANLVFLPPRLPLYTNNRREFESFPPLLSSG